MPDTKSFHLLISNPERTFFDGDVKSVTSKNQQGPFDILPDHAHFISLLHNTKVDIELPDGKRQAYAVVRGLISCKENKVRVFVDL